MREILFRGKRTNNGKWVEGNLFIPDREDTPTQICFGTNVTRITYDVIPETVGQFTGLTDKNGKKIFEWDIVTNHKGEVGRVTWYEELCAFMIYSITENKVFWLFDNDFSLIEVIGNIHDNPELLERGCDNG